MPSRPNILLIMTDEERYHLPRPAGFSLPARERLAARGVSFRDFHVTTGMCSPSRSVIYTGQHVPLTEVYDNSNFPYVHDLDPSLGPRGKPPVPGGPHDPRFERVSPQFPVTTQRRAPFDGGRKSRFARHSAGADLY